MPTKTEQLISKINAGTHRIRGMWVYRFVASRNEWVSEPTWRTDVVRRAAIATKS